MGALSQRIWERCPNVHYTQGQLRNAVGLSKEAFRHWKRVLPGFPQGNSHGPSFSPGDVLAFAVLHRLTQTCGVRIGHLSTVSSRVFEVCNKTSWDVLANRVLVVDLGGQACSMAPKTGRIPGGSAVVVCPMEPLVAMLRDDFLGSSQLALRTAQGRAPECARQLATGRRRR